MSFIDDVDSLKTKLHLQDIPVPLRIGLVVLGAALLFVLFQGLWQLGSGESHLIAGQAPGPGEASQANSGLAVSSDNEDSGPESESAARSRANISVHIVGAVKNPGLYEVLEGSRIQEVVSAAGGFSGDAVEGSVNLARVVQDGEQIVVASKADVAASTSVASSSSAATAAGGSAAAATGLVNINTADVGALTTLSGIGESTAKKIVADREKNGPFKTKKDITRVSGIGDKKYEAIKDSITV